MAFVDDRPVPGDTEWLVIFPSERGIDHDTLRHTTRAVVRIRYEILVRAADLVREQRVAPRYRARDRFRVWIDEQLRCIKAVSIVRIVRAVHAVAVELARPDVRQITVPNLIRT